MLRNTDKYFGSLAKWLHWVAAVLAIGLLIVGYFLRTGSESTFSALISYHKFFAVILFVVMLFRLIWRWVNPLPRVAGVPRIQAIVAWINHSLLYLAVFIMAIAGWLMTSFGGHTLYFLGMNLALPVIKSKSLSHLFGDIHYWAAWALLCFIVLHILAAFYHQLILRDKLINSMLPQKKNGLFK